MKKYRNHNLYYGFAILIITFIITGLVSLIQVQAIPRGGGMGHGIGMSFDCFYLKFMDKSRKIKYNIVHIMRMVL